MRVEGGRYTKPVTPLKERKCLYCDGNFLDAEMHAIVVCSTMSLKRNCFLGKMSSLLSDFENMSVENKLLTILCPKNSEIAICVSKYIGIIIETRKKLDMGVSDDMLGSNTKHGLPPNIVTENVITFIPELLVFWDGCFIVKRKENIKEG